MLNYSAESEGRGERVMLIEIRPEVYGSSDYAHITARVLRAAVPSGVNPDTGREQYNDGPDARGYRNCSWSSEKKNALMVEDLLIWSQLDKRVSGDREKPYGVGARFIDVHTIDGAGEAKHFFNTLSKIDAKMTKLDNEFGYASGDLATYIARVASILGIKRFITYKKDHRNGGDLAHDVFNTWRAKDVAFLVNEMIDRTRGVNA